MSEPSMEELRQQLETALAQHDWYYDRSDDYRHYTAGRAQWAAISELARKLPDGSEIIATYRKKVGL